MKLGKILYILLILVLLGVFCFSGYTVVSYFLEGQQQQAEYDDLANMVENIRNDPTYSPEPVTLPQQTQDPQDPDDPKGGREEPKVLLPEYAPVYELNNHLVGWMIIEGTKVNYPVMQTPDSPDFYLQRNFEGKKASRGCLYAEEACDVFVPSDNITIYGHNMVDGSMFGQLERYQRQSFWEEHRFITFDTLYERHTYEIFAVLRTTASIGEGFPYHKFVNAKDEAAFDEFIATCREMSPYDTGIVPKYGDKLITLSTCEYTQSNGRFVVVAVRID